MVRTKTYEEGIMLLSPVRSALLIYVWECMHAGVGFVGKCGTPQKHSMRQTSCPSRTHGKDDYSTDGEEVGETFAGSGSPHSSEKNDTDQNENYSNQSLAKRRLIQSQNENPE